MNQPSKNNNKLQSKIQTREGRLLHKEAANNQQWSLKSMESTNFEEREKQL